MKTFGLKNASQILQVDASSEIVTIDGYVTVNGTTTVDGAVTINGTTTVDGYIYAQGTVSDGNASADNPLVAGGVYLTDPTASTLSDGYVGSILLTDQRRISTEDRTYDSASDANKNIPVFIPQDRYSFEDLSDSQADSDATISKYVDFQGFSFFSIQLIISGDGYADLTMFVSNEDVSDITSATYTNVTQDFFGASSFGTSTGFSDVWLERDTPCSCKFIRIDITTNGLGGGDTSYFDIFFMKKTA